MDQRDNRYEIRVTGQLGDTLLGAFPELHGEPRGSDTVLTGWLPDTSAVYGVIARLESLGLELVGIHRLPAEDRQARSRRGVY
jgi:hypothetical protein